MEDSTLEGVGRALNNARRVLASFRTEKLRQTLSDVIAGRWVGDKMEGPLVGVSWLSSDGSIDTRRLNEDILLLQKALSPLVAMEAGVIRALPESLEERVRLVEAIFDRIFAGSPHRRTLSEVEVNAALSVLVQDVPGVRRFAVDYGLVGREQDGSAYWLAR